MILLASPKGIKVNRRALTASQDEITTGSSCKPSMGSYKPSIEQIQHNFLDIVPVGLINVMIELFDVIGVTAVNDQNNIFGEITLTISL